MRRIYKEELGVDISEADDLKINFTWVLSAGPQSQKRLLSKMKDTEIEGQDIELFKEIAGELADIFRQVDMGPNPLDGYCDSCPHLRARMEEHG